MSQLSILSRIFKSIFPIFEKELTLIQKMVAILNTLISILIFFVIFIYFFSSMFYSTNIKKENMQIYVSLSHKNKVKNVLNEVEENIHFTYLYNSNYNVEIYFLNQNIFDIFKSFFFYFGKIEGINILGKIFIGNDIIKESTKQNKYLEKIIIHEIVHSLQASKYGGFIRQKYTTPYWVQEGYAVHVASSEDLDKDNSDMEKFIKYFKGSKFEKVDFYNKYRVNGLLVYYAIEHMHKSVDDLHLGKVEYDEVMESLLKEYNISKE